jgi:adenine phosphoribosyltransferase
MDLKKYIRNIPNFPVEGILFRDITPLLANPEAYNNALDQMANFVKAARAEAIVAIESRGFMFACPVAQKLNLPFIPVRKPGKLPYKTKSIEYNLEYGTGILEIHEDSLQENMRVAIVDDLLATGGTAGGAAKLVKLCKASVCAYSFLIELKALKGRELLNGSEVQAILSF